MRASCCCAIGFTDGVFAANAAQKSRVHLSIAPGLLRDVQNPAKSSAAEGRGIQGTGTTVPYHTDLTRRRSSKLLVRAGFESSRACIQDIILSHERVDRGEREGSQFVSSVSIVSTVEARDDGATVDARSMRRRVEAMCAPHHSAASPDVRKSRMRRVSPMRARTDA